MGEWTEEQTTEELEFDARNAGLRRLGEFGVEEEERLIKRDWFNEVQCSMLNMRSISRHVLAGNAMWTMRDFLETDRPTDDRRPLAREYPHASPMPTYTIRRLPNPEECDGYPPSMMLNKPECELNFLLSSNADEPTQALACSFILRDGMKTTSMSEHKLKERLNEIDVSKPVIIICHGLFSWRNQMLISNLASKLSLAMDAHTIRFDFLGNGHSSGEWKFGNVEQDCKDLVSIVDFVHSLNCYVVCIIGHSQGSASVLQYAATCACLEHQGVEIPCRKFVNLAGRYYSPKSTPASDSGRFLSMFDVEDMAQLKEKGYFYVKKLFGGGRSSKFKITQEQIDLRHKRDTNKVVQQINQKGGSIKVLTIHGKKDAIVPIDNAHKYDKEIRNHALHIINGADHNFNGVKYHDEMVDVISTFIIDESDNY